MMTIHANPPSNCDLCSGAITQTFSDARHPRYQRWGNFCDPCAEQAGVTYGTGKGQYYEKQSDGRFVKTKG